MADKNRNGIPDDREGLFRPGQKAKPIAGSITGQKRVRAGVNPFFNDVESAPTPFNPLVNVARQGLNWFGDIGNWGNDSRADRVGTGLGDSVFGVKKGYYDEVNSTAQRPARRQGGVFQRGQGGISGTSPLSFADALAQAMGLIGDGGAGGGVPFVNFDPEREAARSNAAEADSRLGAMYRQLQGSINADAPKIEQAYQQAITNTNTGAQQAQANVQGAVDASQQRNQSVLANLGIQDANSQIIGEGRDANTQAAAAIGDMAQAQQAANTNLTQNQASSVQQNRSIGSAAGLEGNLQRAQNQARLQSLLAQIDSEERGQNASISAQNASQRQGGLQTALSLASQLYGYNRDDIAAENDMQMQAMQMNQPSDFMQMLNNFGLLTQDRGGDLGPIVDSSSLTPEQLAAIFKAIR